ncbi:hypothetical protein [Nocardia sp. NPDC048505]|uniref:hypothetical protein n=1 Tax=unclassified Nocardia TaxID=2637762 RepID=UPI0033FE1EB0
MLTELVVVAIVATLLTTAAIAMTWDPNPTKSWRNRPRADPEARADGLAQHPRDGAWPRKQRR